MTPDEQRTRAMAAELIGKRPGSRGWDRLLNHLAREAREAEIIEAFEETLAALRAEVATWTPAQ